LSPSVLIPMPAPQLSISDGHCQEFHDCWGDECVGPDVQSQTGGMETMNMNQLTLLENPHTIE